MRSKWFRARSIACFFSLFAIAAARPAAAETLSLAWNPSAAPGVTGYVVYVSIQPGGSQATAYDVGNATSFEWSGAVDGQQYYFSVSAYAPGPVLGPRSAEISRFPNLAPSLNNPGSQSSTAGAPAALQLTGSDPEAVALTYGASGLPPGLTLTPANGSIAGVPTTSGNYTVTATVTDGWLSDAKTFTWAVAQAASPNLPAPTNPPAPPNPQPLPPAAGSPLVGAIRHDDWDPTNHRGDDILRLKTDASIRHRLPYHAVATTPAVVNENTQAVIDQDILYASGAGLDYWVMGHYCSAGQYTYQRMKTSPYRSRMKYAFMETSPTQCRVDQLLVEIQDPQYLTVLDGRPVIFLFMPAPYYAQDGTPATIASLRANVLATVGKNPYLIGMDFTASAAASWAHSYGLDAISSYGGGLTCATGFVAYAVQVACEEDQWTQYKNTGRQYVPTITTGWETLGDPGRFTTTEGTPSEIANHLANALTFHATYPSSNPANLLMISAWNEYTENHYLVPNNPATNSVGAGRLNAVAAVLNAAPPVVVIPPTPNPLPPAPTTPTNLAPTLNNPGAQTATAGSSVTLQLVASDPEGAALSYGASGLPAGLQVSSTGRISGAPTVPGTYVVTATVTDRALSDAETFTWSVVQSASDNVAPILTITVPTAASTYAADNPFVTLGGTARDDRRVALVEWISDKMGNGVASGTENWLAGVPLVAGVNTITIRAHDEAGNVSTKTIHVKARPQVFRPGNGRGNARGDTN